MKLRLCSLFFILLFMLPATNASALRFDMESGSVEIVLRQVSSGQDLAHIGPFEMNGPDDFADFSIAPVAMTDFRFSALNIQDQAITDLIGGSTLPGLWGWFNLDVDVIATPGASYSASGTDLGGGDYLLEGTDVDLTGTVTVGHHDGYSKTVSLHFPTYTADANLTITTLILDRMNLGGVVLHDEYGVDHSFEIIANIVFVGELVPEPGTGLLFGLGLAGIATRQRRMRALRE